MARALSPEAAAVRIVQAVADGSAKDAADAIRQNPALKPGLSILEKALQPTAKNTVPTQTRATGSGPMTLGR